MSLQLYIITIVYMVFSAFLLLVDSYRKGLSFMLKAKSKLKSDEKRRNQLFLLGIVIAILKLFFPVAPGPVIIGDLIPSVTILAEAFTLRIVYRNLSEEGKVKTTSRGLGKKETKKFGCIFLSLAALHFIFPSFVML